MLTKPIRLTDHVIDCLNDEFVYQATLHEQGRADTEDHGVAGQLATLRCYANEADVAWVKSKGNDNALDALRKVAAIAIRALVLYGCPRRSWTPEALLGLKGLDQDSLVGHYDRVRRLTEVKPLPHNAAADHRGRLRRIGEAHRGVDPIDASIERLDWKTQNDWTAAATRALYDTRLAGHVGDVVAGAVDPRAIAWSIHNELLHNNQMPAGEARRRGWQEAAKLPEFYVTGTGHNEVTTFSIPRDPAHKLPPGHPFTADWEAKQNGAKGDGRQEMGAQESRNKDYYRGLVQQIGEFLGEEAYIADDGSRQEDVLCAKVPELVRQRLRMKIVDSSANKGLLNEIGHGVQEDDKIIVGDTVMLKHDGEQYGVKMTVGSICGSDAKCYRWGGSDLQTRVIPVVALKKLA